MKFLRSLFRSKPTLQDDLAQRDAAQEVAPIAPLAASRTERPAPLNAPKPEETAGEGSTSALLRGVATKLQSAEVPAGPGAWDMDDDLPSTEELLARAKETPATPKARKARVKTRLVGFDTSGGDVVDLFDEDEKTEDDTPAAAEKPKTPTAPTAAPEILFPVGWLLVVDGPGRGSHFPLTAGMSQIGRGPDQAVRLDFGDASISRSGHAAIVYEEDKRSFHLGQGGSTNIVRLNGTPVIANEAVVQGDEIKLGETTLRLVALCGEDFNWSSQDDEDGEDDEDVAIA